MAKAAEKVFVNGFVAGIILHNAVSAAGQYPAEAAIGQCQAKQYPRLQPQTIILDGIEHHSRGQDATDTAVLAYRNVLRIQGWIGSLYLVMERELFVQEPMSELSGVTVGERIEREMHQLEQSLMPLLDRAHRMLVRSLDRLEARRSRGGPQAQVSVGHAGQVKVGSAVRNGAS